jgi:hypothetical protein
MTKKEHFPLVNRLHTDVLRDTYGDVHVEVLEHNENLRVADIVSEDGMVLTRAVTLYGDSSDREMLAEIDMRIKDGGLIGEVFRDEGYEIRKNVIDVFSMEIPEQLRNKFSTKKKFAKARTSEFYARKDQGDVLLYGLVTEVYHPEFRLPVVNEVDLDQISASTEVLERKGVSRLDVWNSIGDQGSYKNSEILDVAKEESLSMVLENRDRIKEYLMVW